MTRQKLAADLARGDRASFLINGVPLVEVAETQAVEWSNGTRRRIVCHSPRGDEYHVVLPIDWLVSVEEREARPE